MGDSLEDVKEFLSHPRTVAVIGASNKSHRAGHYVPKFLQDKGWKIIPINPFEDEILGEECLNNQSELDDMEIEIEGILVYRHTKAAKEEAIDAIENNRTSVIWFPDNVRSNLVASKAEEAGITFIQDRCPLRDYRTFMV